MKANSSFLNKTCTLSFKSGFVIDGIVVDIDCFGILFKTTQKTSFVSWDSIAELTPKNREGQ